MQPPTMSNYMVEQNNQPTDIARKEIKEENPFAKIYPNVNMPDTPLNYGGGMVESLLNDNEVPKEIKEKFWFIFHKDNTLTFLDEKRMMQKMMAFDIMKIDVLNSMPYYEYTFDVELQFGVLRNTFETKLDRSLGIKGGNVKNERIILQSQFSEQKMISENSDRGNIKGGFFKRLLSRGGHQ